LCAYTDLYYTTFLAIASLGLVITLLCFRCCYTMVFDYRELRLIENQVNGSDNADVEQGSIGTSNANSSLPNLSSLSDLSNGENKSNEEIELHNIQN
jgi:hypothetical protein